MATVIIPTPLRKFTENNARLETDETTVQSALRSLSEKYPDLRRHLFDDAGNIRPFLNIFVGEDDIRDRNQGETPLDSNAVLSIVPAIAGG
ncbi:MAG: MoaD/ThiS family protein [Bacteroidota bacterium]|jgi:molybdopterin converting factor small subunit